MKYLLTLLCASLLAGCACAPVYSRARNGTGQQLVLNNTTYRLDVQVDGVPYAAIEPGQTVTVPARVFYGKTVVVVLAYRAGEYVGTDNWTFRADLPEVWQVNNVWQQHSVNRY